jgi:hypothetical protein
MRCAGVCCDAAEPVMLLSRVALYSSNSMHTPSGGSECKHQQHRGLAYAG